MVFQEHDSPQQLFLDALVVRLATAPTYDAYCFPANCLVFWIRIWIYAAIYVWSSMIIPAFEASSMATVSRISVLSSAGWFLV